MEKMEILSSLRITKTVLAILSLVLLSNIRVQAQGILLLPSEKSSQRDLSTSQIGEGDTTNAHDSILKFVNSSNFPNRVSFPRGFLFGAGTSAAQIEGGSHEGGRGLGIFDELFSGEDKFATKIEHYKRYKEDVQHLKNLGVNSYRMSICWNRVIPDGTLKGGINKEGINFYNNLINELLNNGIEPFVTILHLDYPLALQKKFGGFLNHSIVKHFKDYSELLFKTFGDRVKHWATLNEPEVQVVYESVDNVGNWSMESCQTTKVCTEIYTELHILLIAHATASKLYKSKFQAIQKGEIGITISSESYVPYSSKLEDVDAAQRLTDFTWGWVLEPLFHGDYPQIMRKLVGKRLPKFTKNEKEMLKGSIDFIGINYYSSHYVRHEPNRTKVTGGYFDALANLEDINAEGKTLGYWDQYGGTYVYPEGLYNFLLYLNKKYKNSKIYINENGIPSIKIPNPLNDEHRTAFIAAHINATKSAIDDGVNVRGYFAWAAFDTFDFYDGYSHNMGLYHVDFNDCLKRVPTNTAKWYKKYLTHDLDQ
uniref:Glycoside hydrolase family 1 protein n=1 Tax=Medicago truncatula TaxID=3880 RepID=B7FM50_MEDTR|nr:unknown [Medicago truncatula]